MSRRLSALRTFSRIAIATTPITTLVFQATALKQGVISGKVHCSTAQSLAWRMLATLVRALISACSHSSRSPFGTPTG